MQYNPSFTAYRPILTEEDKTALSELSKMYSLKRFLSSSRMYEEMSLDFVYTSAKIEGNTYDRLDTNNLLKLGITAGGKRYSDAVMLVNLRNGFQEVMNISDRQVIGIDYVSDIHALLMKDLLPSFEQGIGRRSGVNILGTDYTPLDNPERLRTEFKYLLNESSKYTDPFEKSIYLHCNLAYLQYFRDGNKRTARLIQSAALVQGKKMPLFFNETLIDQYLKSAVHYYETGDYTPYISFFKENYRMSQITLIQGKENVLTDEALERIKKIPLISGGSTPERVFRDIVQESLSHTDVRFLNWQELEMKTAAECLNKGYAVNNIIQAIQQYSPTCISKASQENFADDVKRMAERLKKQSCSQR